MRVLLENGAQHLVQHFAAQVERTQFHITVYRDDLEQRARGGEVPARIPSWKFISGGQIGAAMRVQVLQKAFQSLFVAGFRDHAGDGDTAASEIPEFAHDPPGWVTTRIP